MILKAVILLGLLGLVFGLILDFASKKFAVEVDPREEEILGVLPGANCGGCGYPGCGGLAAAVVKGEAPVNGCPVGGAAVAEKVAGIMGVEAESGARKVAKVICKGDSDCAKEKYSYEGYSDCRAASVLNGGPKSCKYGCLGLGSCVQVCAFDAIHIVNGVAVVDEEKCVHCGKCIDICPKNLIISKPVDKQVVVECSSLDFGKAVKDNCTVGCIGCGICEKTCKFEAIKLENKLAKIDFDKCVQCNMCANKCPTGAIKPKERKQPKKAVEPKKIEEKPMTQEDVKPAEKKAEEVKSEN